MKKSEIWEGGHTPSISSIIATYLDGILSENRTASRVVKSPGFFAVSDSYCSWRNFRSPSAAGYACLTRE